jgi:hypothetical protein
MPTFASSRIGHVAFWLWVVGGIPWVVGIWYRQDCWERRFPNDLTERTFLYVKPTPEQWAQWSAEERHRWAEGFEQQEAKDRFHLVGWCLWLGLVVYELAGFALFRHSRRSAGAVAVAIVVMTFLAGLKIDIR